MVNMTTSLEIIFDISKDFVENIYFSYSLAYLLVYAKYFMLY